MVGTSAKDFARGRVSAVNAFISETVVIQRVAITAPCLCECAAQVCRPDAAQPRYVILRSPALWDDEGSRQFAGNIHPSTDGLAVQKNCRDSSAPKGRGPQNDMGSAFSSPIGRSLATQLRSNWSRRLAGQ